MAITPADKGLREGRRSQPPLEHGDHLTRSEFERCHADRPDLKHAELIDGRVYLPAPRTPRGRAEAGLAGAMPALENGDRLTIEEFERRYEAMPWLKKAELVGGSVYMGSPVYVEHGEAHAHVMAWLGLYVAMTRGVHLYDNTTVRLESGDEVQPDALLRLEPTQGGRSRIGPQDYIEGAPELVLEIAASSRSYDLHEKLDSYRRNRVQEYVVWRVFDEALDWFQWRDENYYPRVPEPDGLIRSEVFAGLWLHVEALMAGELNQVINALQQGMASAEHQEFVRRLSGGSPA